MEETMDSAPQGRNVVEFSLRKSEQAKEPARRRISNAAVAVVGLAIVMGSRGVTGDTQAATVKPGYGPKLKRGDRTLVPGTQALHNS
jgi:hypothetical protein